MLVSCILPSAAFTQLPAWPKGGVKKQEVTQRWVQMPALPSAVSSLTTQSNLSMPQFTHPLIRCPLQTSRNPWEGRFPVRPSVEHSWAAGKWEPMPGAWDHPMPNSSDAPTRPDPAVLSPTVSFRVRTNTGLGRRRLVSTWGGSKEREGGARKMTRLFPCA